MASAFTCRDLRLKGRAEGLKEVRCKYVPGGADPTPRVLEVMDIVGRENGVAAQPPARGRAAPVPLHDRRR